MKKPTTRIAAKQRREISQKLLERKSQVLAGLGVKFDTLAAVGRVAEDDQAQISHDEFITLQLNSMDYEQLRLINDALQRLRSGNYGVCQACEEPISSRRLRALPWARYCIECQERMANVGFSEEDPLAVSPDAPVVR